MASLHILAISGPHSWEEDLRFLQSPVHAVWPQVWLLSLAVALCSALGF
jgi:hypothetical protein